MSESRQHLRSIGTTLDFMTHIQTDPAVPNSATSPLIAHPIPAARLDEIRSRGADDLGNRVEAAAATGDGEPLRCCLRYAVAGEAIALISYSPGGQGVWREVGPVYVHADGCPGPTTTSLPEEMRDGSRVLRAYRPDGSMNYEQNTFVPEGEDIEDGLRRLLGDPDVSKVHVRTVLPQCYLFSVTMNTGERER